MSAQDSMAAKGSMVAEDSTSAAYASGVGSSTSILVTGGRGFLGRYVVADLLELGHTVVDYNRDPGPPSTRPEHVPVLGEISDVPRLLETIRRHKVERIVHTAAQSHPAVSLDMPLATMEANVMGTTCVLEAARLSGVRRVVLFSSECVYGTTSGATVPESTPLDPSTPYGVSKAATEMLGRSYSRSFGLDTVSLRVSAIYGPGQVMQETVRDAIKAALAGEPFRRPDGGDERLQLVHVTDVARATVAACLLEESHEPVYNVTGGVQPTLREVLDLVRECVPDARFSVGPGVGSGDQQGLFDLQAARRDLRYKPQVALRDGLREYVEWLKTSQF